MLIVTTIKAHSKISSSHISRSSCVISISLLVTQLTALIQVAFHLEYICMKLKIFAEDEVGENLLLC